ncbi:MAG: GIY-YIG nuclease family protein [Lysobacterales bacterium]|nr:MAG: GIY-YIG nuclease family protein [Xanthomonadales bacterium]
MQRAQLAQQLRAAARSQIHGANGGVAGSTAIYTLADPRDVRCARYVGQTRDPRRRFAQHVHAARLWLPDVTPWWVRSPEERPLFAWIRALHSDGGRLPFMWVAEWAEPGADPLAAERAEIMRLLAQGAGLLNAEARLLGAQLPLL